MASTSTSWDSCAFNVRKRRIAGRVTPSKGSSRGGLIVTKTEQDQLRIHQDYGPYHVTSPSFCNSTQIPILRRKNQIVHQDHMGGMTQRKRISHVRDIVSSPVLRVAFSSLLHALKPRLGPRCDEHLNSTAQPESQRTGCSSISRFQGSWYLHV